MSSFASISRWRPGLLARNTMQGTLGYGLRIAAQALYFVALARWLGSEGFGLFAGIWVLGGFLSVVSSLGFPVLVMKATALAPNKIPPSFGHGLRVTLTLSLPVGTLFIFAGAAWLPDSSVSVLIFFSISEILLIPLLNLIAAFQQGRERLGRSHLVLASLWLVRLLGLCFLIFNCEPDFSHAATIHLVATLLVTGGWLAWLRLRHRDDIDLRWPGHSELKEGVSFGGSAAALIAYTELNQSMTLSLVSAHAAASLAVPYKLVALASAPIAALCQAVAPRLVRDAKGDVEQLIKTLKQLITPVAAYVSVCCGGLWIAAGFIDEIFGPDYADAVAVARALSLLPLFSGVRLLSVYMLAALDCQGLRLAVELVCLVIGIGANLLLISSHGLQGAVLGSLLAEFAAAVALAVTAWASVGRYRLQSGNEKGLRL